jgi:hypothetical protein
MINESLRVDLALFLLGWVLWGMTRNINLKQDASFLICAQHLC